VDSLRNRRLAPVLLAPVLLVLAVTVAGSAAFRTWLPLLLAVPWLVAIAWFGSRDTGDSRGFPSAAEAARDRLWVH
jgi:hypothetical protein